MAANPQLPPQEPREPQRETGHIAYGRKFPWALIAAIITIICLGLLAWYYFR